MSDPADPLSSHVGAVVLAAGQGTRMRSRLPKVLHSLLGRPMVAYVLDALTAVGVRDVVVVVGHGADQVRAALGERVRYAVQAEQRGTGHAVLQALPQLPPHVSRTLVLYGDTPLLRAETLQALLAASTAAGEAGTGPPLALLTARSQIDGTANGYGRVLRDEQGRIVGLVEERDASPTQRGISEINVGAYVFDTAWLRAHVPMLRPSPSGEYYLTDLVAMAAAEGCPIAAVPLTDPTEGLGVNDRVQLALAANSLRQRVLERLMRAGVTIVDPMTTYVEATVTIGQDTVLHPQTFLYGRTTIGADCEIGPGTEIYDSEIGDRCRVWRSVLEGATLATDVQVGPFSHLRPGARLASGVMVGNYAEVKNSILHEGVAQHHFSYLGDAEVGRDTNVGAGTITCNYDGVDKHRTVIGERVFLGSDTLLVAPVRLGDDSGTGAGAVVTRDVPAGKLAVGVPARILRDRGAPLAEATASPSSDTTEDA